MSNLICRKVSSTIMQSEDMWCWLTGFLKDLACFLPMLHIKLGWEDLSSMKKMRYDYQYELTLTNKGMMFPQLLSALDSGGHIIFFIEICILLLFWFFCCARHVLQYIYSCYCPFLGYHVRFKLNCNLTTCD